jgi:hypothetical protein
VVLTQGKRTPKKAPRCGAAKNIMAGIFTSHLYHVTNKKSITKDFLERAPGFFTQAP